MKKLSAKSVLDTSHSLMNEMVIGTANELENAYFEIKIDELLKERGLTQKDLARIAGMRDGTVSELVNGKGLSINKVQILAIMAVLRVTSLSEIIEIKLPENLETSYFAESKEWKETKQLPNRVKEIAKENFTKTLEG